jgi:hypothetical protein
MTLALRHIERVNLVLAVAMTALGGLLWGTRGLAGAGAGAFIACADFFVLRRVGARGADRVRAGGPPRGVGFALIGKMAALFGLVFVAIRVAHLAVIPFALGFSVFVMSILLVGLRAAQTEPEA